MIWCLAQGGEDLLAVLVICSCGMTYSLRISVIVFDFRQSKFTESDMKKKKDNLNPTTMWFRVWGGETICGNVRWFKFILIRTQLILAVAVEESKEWL